jgi:hypothetical protein
LVVRAGESEQRGVRREEVFEGLLDEMAFWEV